MKNNRYIIRATDPLLRPGLSIETVASEKYLADVTTTLLDKVREINASVRVAELPPVWIVGQVREEKDWEFQGVFNTEQEAIEACVDENYFIGPAIFGQPCPRETVHWHGAYWPKAV